MYLNCPTCSMSIRRANARPLAEDCPRCMRRLGRKVPLFPTERPYRYVLDELAAGRAGGAAGDRRGAA